MKLNLTHYFTLTVTGHGNINSYLHRFKTSDTPSCPCGPLDQTTDCLLFECELLKKERNDLTTAILKKTTAILKTDVWPMSKPGLIKKHYKAFFKFTNAILIDKLTNPKPNGDS